MSNALVNEKSPYLRQHADNPVDWLPWGEAAFEKARREDKPIFLSAGYSTCHWCHVMAHESFEDQRVAEVLNREFVSIKVDREERPDVDRIYMLFVQASTGSGGWPMSVFLTPDLKPFFGGTYFPPDSRYGRPGFIELLRHLSNAWRNDRERINSASENVVDQLRAYSGSSNVERRPLDRSLFEAGFAPLRRSFDSHWGGFGSAPKFPRPAALNYLLRYHALEKSEEAHEMADATLRHMALGGMHDQLGGGFHRYSVDERWFVPHFEKMLYDQAQLALSYLEMFQITGDELLAAVASRIFEYVLRDLTDPGGAFYSAEDADSARPENPGEHGEGAFYVWTQAEMEATLSPDEARLFALRFGVEPNGNVREDPHQEFGGRNILYQARTQEEISAQTGLEIGKITRSLERSCAILFEARAKRPRPHLDNKVLAAWNGLMISAFAKGFAVLGDRRWLNAAERAADFLFNEMYRGDGTLLRRYCEGEAAVPAFLDDYAFLAQAALDLFEVSGKPEYLERAIQLTESFSRFEDPVHGGFFSNEAGSSDLLLRIKDDYDGAEPAGNTIATDVLLRLAHLTGRDSFRQSAEKSLQAFAPKLRSQPTTSPQMLGTVGRYFAEPEQMVIRCASLDAGAAKLLFEQSRAFRPYASVIAITDEGAPGLVEIAPFLASLERRGRLTIYHCRNFVCELPHVIE